MMENILGLLDYIKTFFSPLESPKKRRAVDSLEPLVSPKFRKRSNSMSREADEFFSTRSSFHRPLLSRPVSVFKTSPKFPRFTETVVLDDDDDVDIIETKRPDQPKMNRSRFTSTPANPKSKERLYMNGTDDDVEFVMEERSTKDKKLEARKLGLNYISPQTSGLDIRPIRSASALQNGLSTKDKSSIKGRSSLNKNPTLDYSIRLDDKLRYKKLLDNIANSPTDSSIYHTPMGKLFNFDGLGRGAKTAETTNSRNTSAGSLNTSKSRLSAKDKIIKILDDFESEPVVIKDSDTDDDVIICPPSPKPDIKVQPVNSLKIEIDTSERTKKDWLDQIVDRHKKQVEEREKELKLLRETSEKHNQINRDIRLAQITHKINHSLSIKGAILPEEEVYDVELPTLTEEHLRLVKKAFSGDQNEVLAKKFNLTINRRDIMTLAGLNWLNDEVINFYMNLIIERSKGDRYPKTYAMNTFFYSKIVKDGPSSVRRWTKKIDIFAHDLICIPIHLGMHWCMAVVDFRDKTIRYYDSMGSPNGRCLEAIRDYLEVEYKDKKQAKLDTSGFLLESVKDIPQQMNGSDCGMFSCTFAEFLSRNATITFSQEDMPYLRKKMVVEIMTGELLIK